jgi:hypothetical protein
LCFTLHALRLDPTLAFARIFQRLRFILNLNLFVLERLRNFLMMPAKGILIISVYK